MACAASPMSCMRPRPQFCVSGRVNRPHFEHSVTRLKSFSRRGSGLGKLNRISSGSPRVDQPSSTHLSVSCWVTMFTSFLPRIWYASRWQPGPTHWIWPVGSSTIGEGEHDALAALLDAGQAVPQVNRAVVEPARERVQEVGAVKAVVGR